MQHLQEGLHKRYFLSDNDNYSPRDSFLLAPLRFPRFNENARSRTAFAAIIAVLVVILLIVSFIAGYFVRGAPPPPLAPPDPRHAPPPSWSKLHAFKKAAVCTDAAECSAIGSSVLAEGGSAVDAAVAAMFCNGLLNQQSMGVGGGFFMTVWVKAEERAYTVTAREAAPAAATRDMFHGDKDKASKGPLSVAVPGEVRGLALAHARWGRLSWARLLQPTVTLCSNGFNMSRVMYDSLLVAPWIVNDPLLRKQYYDEEQRAFYRPGRRVYPSAQLCGTLARLAARGGGDLYDGELAADLAHDLRRLGTLITPDDLRNYTAVIKPPISVKLGSDTLHSVRPPASGALLALLLATLSRYGLSADSLRSPDNAVLTYHRVIEAFKFAYAERSKLGDEDFVDLKELLQNITSPEYAAAVRARIDDYRTYNESRHYGADAAPPADAGTAHLSVIAPDGDAVAVTSSVNYYFGSGMAGPRTGIVLNNVMDDFSFPGITNYFGLPPSPANFAAPRKRPLSSMTPTIVVDGNGNAKMVIGASGGTKITTAVAMTIMRKLWFGQSLKEAVDAPRIHHQLLPPYVEYEYGVTEDIVEGLKLKGHGMVRYRDRGSIVCALFRNETSIYANADFRKGGEVVGM